MNRNKAIAIDAMGGEHGAAVTVPASLLALEQNRDLQIYLVGDESAIRAQAQFPAANLQDRLQVIHTPFALSDQDKPTRALRDREKSSMVVAVEMVRDQKAEACVSAGNTGALLLTGRHLLKTLPGIDKPAIVAVIPGASKDCLLLDVGANVDCRAEQLFQFAVMGSVLAESLGIAQRARVGLLNIGVEEYKGTEQVRAAAALLEQCQNINYCGFVEGNALFSGAVDVVVCDGFAGNVTIKSSAGVIGVINRWLQEDGMSNLSGKLASLVARPLIKKLQSRIDPAQYNGASLLGLQGSIIKSHSNTTVKGFNHAINRAIKEAENRVPQLIADKVAAIVMAPGSQ